VGVTDGVSVAVGSIVAVGVGVLVTEVGVDVTVGGTVAVGVAVAEGGV